MSYWKYFQHSFGHVHAWPMTKQGKVKNLIIKWTSEDIVVKFYDIWFWVRAIIEYNHHLHSTHIIARRIYCKTPSFQLSWIHEPLCSTREQYDWVVNHQHLTAWKNWMTCAIVQNRSGHTAIPIIPAFAICNLLSTYYHTGASRLLVLQSEAMQYMNRLEYLSKILLTHMKKWHLPTPITWRICDAHRSNWAISQLLPGTNVMVFRSTHCNSLIHS